MNKLSNGRDSTTSFRRHSGERRSPQPRMLQKGCTPIQTVDPGLESGVTGFDEFYRKDHLRIHEAGYCSYGNKGIKR